LKWFFPSAVEFLPNQTEPSPTTSWATTPELPFSTAETSRSDRRCPLIAPN